MKTNRRDAEGAENVGRESEAHPADLHIDDSERTPCEVWTRVMGYHRPVSAFNAGKRAEHRERKYFREDEQ